MAAQFITATSRIETSPGQAPLLTCFNLSSSVRVAAGPSSNNHYKNLKQSFQKKVIKVYKVWGRSFQTNFPTIFLNQIFKISFKTDVSRSEKHKSCDEAEQSNNSFLLNSDTS